VPVTAAAVPESREGDGWVTASVQVDPDDPVFDGHYPGFPVLPGVYVIEHVHQAVLAEAGRMRLVALERAKFVRPVRPDDELRIEARLTADGDQVQCAATVFTGAGPAAEFRLRYLIEPGGQS
jgi:3-hydroxyacyl-[acyl-carrier-protein] dehydratase